VPLGHPQALILAPDHVRRVLDHSPEPFASASTEKRSVVSHFAPRNVLISHGAERTERRRFNEAVLDANCPRHRLADRFLAVVAEEAERLLADARSRGELDWDAFIVAWYRAARRVICGDAAGYDRALTDLLARLRADANWAFLRPRRAGLRRRFYDRLNEHLARAEPGSLAALIAALPAAEATAPADQVAQWLFAFDAAGIATFRTLALLAAHPAQAERAREEIGGHEALGRTDLPYLRACVLESVRLWPTTPLIHRQSTRQTTWETGVLLTQTGIAILVPFFHRDDERLPYAHRFAPELWLADGAAEAWPLIPFSGGPGTCPGRNLVLLMGSTMLAALLADRQVRLRPPSRLDARRPLPGTLNHFALRFALDG
jgi:cytochrome P450